MEFKNQYHGLFDNRIVLGTIGEGYLYDSSDVTDYRYTITWLR
jgi:hypothetical protein